jgi:hypothetical protein
MSNLKKDNSDSSYQTYKPLNKDWNYVGDGKSHDPTKTDSRMRGMWTISMKDEDSKTFKKLNNGQ